MPRKKKETVPELVTLSLTDEDLAPIRARAQAHSKAADKFRSGAINAELNNPEIGSLTVPQVTEFDMSAAFNKAAVTKAGLAGFNTIRNLRKTPQGWVFEALNETPHQL